MTFSAVDELTRFLLLFDLGLYTGDKAILRLIGLTTATEEDEGEEGGEEGV